jgi:lysophospholipase L1-like esterase
MWVRRTAGAVVVGLLAALPVVVAPRAVPAGAGVATVDQPPRAVRWLAMGDSYSSGEGVNPNYGHCAESPGAYAKVARRRLDEEGFRIKEQDFFACSGAQVPNVTGSVDLVEQIERATGRYDLITFSIGGNDGGFGDLMRQCLALSCALSEPLAEVEAEYTSRIDAVQPKLVDIYRRIIDELLAPGGHIVVLGYPRLFEASENWPWYIGSGCETLARPETDMIRRLADHANAMIAEAVANYPGVMHFLDISDAFEGHNLCAGFSTINEWINGITVGYLSNRRFRYMHSFHPNAQGHAVEGRMLADYVKSLDWSGLPGTVILRYGGLTVETGGREVVADVGEPVGTDVVAAISTALGEPLFDVGSAAYGMCQGTVERYVAWEPEREASAALIVALVGRGSDVRLLGYRSYADAPSIEMADGVAIGDPVVSLHLAYLLSATEVVVLPDRLDGGAAPYELRGGTPRGPELGTLTGPTPEATVVDRGSGEQCGLGSLLGS